MPAGDFGTTRHPDDQHYRFTHLYASPMVRALQTAHPIAAALGMGVEVWTDVHEHGGMFLEESDGTLTGYGGLTRAQMQAQFPTYHLPAHITADGWWDAARGRETWADFYGRALRVALALQARAETNERIAIVCHGLFMDALLKALTQQLPPQPHAIFFAHWNTAITRVDFNERPDLLRLHYHNRIEHLPAELRTW
jgi:broad specificity phosphatase PhoE